MAFKKRFLAKLSEVGLTVSRFTDESAGYQGYEIKALDVNVVNSTPSSSAGVGEPDDAAYTGTGDASLVSLGKAEYIANGEPDDAAWSGSGNGNIISILKAIWARFASKLAATAVSNAVTDQAAQLAAGAYALPATASAAALDADVLVSTDVGNFKSLTIQVGGNLSGTWRIQGSMDNANWIDLAFMPVGGASQIAPVVSSTVIVGIFVALLHGVRYVRVRVTARSSGTMTGIVMLHTLDSPPVFHAPGTNSTLPAYARGDLTNNGAAPASTHIGVLTTIANAAQQAWTEGRAVLLSVDLAGFLRVRGYRANIPVTFTLDTSAYAAGDLLADTQVITNLAHANDEPVYLDTISLVDVDDVGDDLTLYILGSSASMGTENSAPSINDANSLFIQAAIQVPASGWSDVGGAKMQRVNFSPVNLYPASGTRNLYVALVLNTGTPTHTATGITGRFGGC